MKQEVKNYTSIPLVLKHVMKQNPTMAKEETFDGFIVIFVYQFIKEIIVVFDKITNYI